MINLVLDTNTWIYLANGFNPKSNQHDEELHFLLIEKLKEKIENEEFFLYTNEIILKEWQRNKNKCYGLIEKYENLIKQKQNELRNNRRKSNYMAKAKTVKEEVRILNDKIEKNRNHIQNIEEILNSTSSIPIKDKHK